MAEEFQGGVCGGMWWNSPLNLFSSPCSVAQLGGAYDMGSCGWPNELVKSKSYNQVYDNSLVFPLDHMDSNALDALGFGLLPTYSTTDWDQLSLLCKGGSNEENLDSLIQDHMMNSCNNMNQNGSPPMTMTASSNSSGDSSTITCEGSLSTTFPMNSSASYLIQSLFDDVIDESQLINNPSNYGSMNSSSPSNEFISPCSWVESDTCNDIPLIQQAQSLQLLPQSNNKFNGEMNVNSLMNGGQVSNGQYNNTTTTLSNIRASLLNSLQSRSRGTSFNQKSHSSLTKEVQQESKKNLKKNDQPPAKRPRIETPSSLPTFKVRKEKLGDRITALQQLVSPFSKTDTASVLHEAIEYIKFLHDQVNVLSTPYLKNGAAMKHQQGLDKRNNNEESEQDLRSRGLCLVPISSTYPVAQETPVDFWTPTFGGTSFR